MDTDCNSYYNDVLEKMRLLLEDAKTLKDKLFYSIGIARSNIYMKNYDAAEQILNDLIVKTYTDPFSS